MPSLSATQTKFPETMSSAVTTTVASAAALALAAIAPSTAFQVGGWEGRCSTVGMLDQSSTVDRWQYSRHPQARGPGSTVGTLTPSGGDIHRILPGTAVYIPPTTPVSCRRWWPSSASPRSAATKPSWVRGEEEGR